MRWQGLPGLSLVAFGLVLVGCQASHSGAAGPGPDLAGSGGGPVRAQKPEAGPERPPPAPPLKPIEPDLTGDGDRMNRAALIRAVVNGEAILDEEAKWTRLYQSVFLGAR